MTISKERYDELIQGIVGYQMFKDVLEDKELTPDEKIYQMMFVVETVEKETGNVMHEIRQSLKRWDGLFLLSGSAN